MPSDAPEKRSSRALLFLWCWGTLARVAESRICDLNFLWIILSDRLCIHLLKMEIVDTASRSPGWQLGYSSNT